MIKVQDYCFQFFIDFIKEENVQVYQVVFVKVWKEFFGKYYLLIIDGQEVDIEGKIQSINFCDIFEVVGIIVKVIIGDVENVL